MDRLRYNKVYKESTKPAIEEKYKENDQVRRLGFFKQLIVFLLLNHFLGNLQVIIYLF